MKYLFLVLFFSNSSFALPGSPREINCSIEAQEMTISYSELTRLIKKACGTNPSGSCNIENIILSYTKRVVIHPLETYKCDPSYNGKVVVCSSHQKVDGIVRLGYGFNSQSGSLYLEDKVSGQVASSNWLNQHDVTQSGYLHTSLTLKNYKGGLLGQDRIWEVTAGCYASMKQF